MRTWCASLRDSLDTLALYFWSYIFVSARHKMSFVALQRLQYIPQLSCTGAVILYCYATNRWSGSGGIQAWSWRTTGFLQCFDIVGLVIWPEKSSPKWPIMCWVGRKPIHYYYYHELERSILCRGHYALGVDHRWPRPRFDVSMSALNFGRFMTVNDFCVVIPLEIIRYLSCT